MRNCLRVILERKNGGKLSQYLAVLSANIVILITGIHIGWTSPSLKKIMSNEYPFEVSEEEASYIAIIGFAGDIVGGVCVSSLIDRLGRRNTLLSIAIPYILSFLLVACSNCGTAFLYCARVLGGIGEGGAFAVIPLYAAEVADPDIRGKLGTFQLTILGVGQLFINIISEYMSIQTVAAICLIFPIIFLLIFSQMPETPYYLLSKNRKVAAMDSLMILRRTSEVEKELEVLENDVQRQMSEEGGFRELFLIPVNRKAFILANVTRFLQQMSGCSAVGSYYQLLVAKSAPNIPPMFSTSMLLLLQILLTVTSFYYVDLYGRKLLLVLSASLTSVVLFILAGFITLKDFTYIDTSGLEWFPLLMMVFYVISFILGLGAVTNILTAEMYSTNIKAKATAISSVHLSLLMMATIKYYQYTADHMSQAVPFLTFAVFTCFSTFFFRYCLIETKGKSLERIQQELMATTRG